MLSKEVEKVIQKLAKWRFVFASWQLGTRGAKDPECQAVRDHRELTILLRAEIHALVSVLVKNGVFTEEELIKQLKIEAEYLDKAYEEKFPGFTTSEAGVHIDAKQGAETMKYWRK